jgi:hypothetical protein
LPQTPETSSSHKNYIKNKDDLFCRTKLGIKGNMSEKDKNQKITYKGLTKYLKNPVKSMVLEGVVTEWE